MITVRNRHTRIERLRDKVAGLIRPDPEISLELKTLEEAELYAIKSLASHEGFKVLRLKMEEAIEAEKEFVFSLSTDRGEQATIERTFRAAIVECYNKVLEMVDGSVEKVDDLQQDDNARDQIAKARDLNGSSSLLSRLREGVLPNG